VKTNTCGHKPDVAAKSTPWGRS